MHLQRLAGIGLIAAGALALSHQPVVAGAHSLDPFAHHISVPHRSYVQRVADPPPVPRERGEGQVWREPAARPRRSLREYLFRQNRFGGRRYRGPPTAFSQTYFDDNTANGFDYGGRCARTSYMCELKWGYPDPKYDGCMQEYGCRVR